MAKKKRARPGMLVPWDPREPSDVPVKLTADYIAAVEAVLRAECAMMMAHDPSATWWQWGRAEISHFSASNGLVFMFGGFDDDPPEDGFGAFAVVIVPPEDDE